MLSSGITLIWMIWFTLWINLGPLEITRSCISWFNWAWISREIRTIVDLMKNYKMIVMAIFIVTGFLRHNYFLLLFMAEGRFWFLQNHIFHIQFISSPHKFMVWYQRKCVSLKDREWVLCLSNTFETNQLQFHILRLIYNESFWSALDVFILSIS